jgi:hypothetical protein
VREWFADAPGSSRHNVRQRLRNEQLDELTVWLSMNEDRRAESRRSVNVGSRAGRDRTPGTCCSSPGVCNHNENIVLVNADTR